MDEKKKRDFGIADITIENADGEKITFTDMPYTTIKEFPEEVDQLFEDFKKAERGLIETEFKVYEGRHNNKKYTLIEQSFAEHQETERQRAERQLSGVFGMNDEEVSRLVDLLTEKGKEETPTEHSFRKWGKVIDNAVEEMGTEKDKDKEVKE